MNDIFVRQIDKVEKKEYDKVGMEGKENTFARLFKQLRLKSGFSTLKEFADALAQEGLVYDESLFSHWQKGDRVPKDRHLLLILINLFIKNGGITTIEEANSFLASTGQRDLDKEELRLFSKNIAQEKPFTVPDQLPLFVGRERYLKEATWRLLNKEPILLYGVAGVGKTALAIKIAHLLKDKFSDGIIWYRCDIKKLDEILNDIAKILGEDVYRIKDNEIKIQIITNLLSTKNILLILDNIESQNVIEPFLAVKKLSFSLLATSKYFFESLKKIKQIKITGFDQKEITQLAKKILGTPFVLMNLNKLKQLARLVGYNPLALSVLMKVVEVSPSKLNLFISRFEKETSFLYQSLYDNKTLYQSLSFSFEVLPSLIKQVLTSLGIFQGADFSSEAVAYINNITITSAIKKLTYLQKFSFVENSVGQRYRLHPLIAAFIRDKAVRKEFYHKLALYFLKLLSQTQRGTSENYAFIEKDLDNILGVFEKCYQLGFYRKVVELWNFIGVFLWDRGYWIKMRDYERLITDACKKTADDRSLALYYVRELSWLYFWQGDIKRAQKYGEKGLSLAMRIKDDFIIALGKQRLGMVYQKQNKLEQAQVYLNEALKIFKKLGEETLIGDTLLYLGHLLRKKGKIERGEKYYLESYRKLKMNNDLEGSAIVLYYLGELNLQRKKLSQAQRFFNRALLIDSLKNRRAGVAWCSWGLGEVHLLKGDINEGRKLLHQAKKIFLNLGMNEQIKTIDKRLL